MANKNPDPAVTDNKALPADALLAAKFRELNHKLTQEEAGKNWDGWDGWAANSKELFRFTQEALRLGDVHTRTAVLDALAAVSLPTRRFKCMSLLQQFSVQA